MAGARCAANVLRAAGVGVLVFCFSGATFAVEPDEEVDTGPPPKASICLAGPKGAAPKGERWYYRVERGTKRHCWYTRGENGRRTVERAPPRPAETTQFIENPADPPKPPAGIQQPTEAPAPLQLSVANARAEAKLSAVPPQQPSAPMSVAAPDSIPPAVSERANWKLAERWSNDAAAAPQPAPAVQEIARAIQPRPAQPITAPPRMPPPKPEPIEETDDSSPSEFADITAAALAIFGLVTIVVAVVVLRRQPNRSDDWRFGRRAAANVRPRLHPDDNDGDDPPPGWRPPRLDVAQIPRPHPKISRRQA